jgi:osmotically-inducible protein OsmY
MKRSYVVAALITAGLLGAPLAGCAGDSKNPSTGEIIDDTAISTKVRAQLIGDKDLNLFQIDVTTDNGIVQLSGAVNNAAAKARATQVASSVSGVKSVRNNLIVR